MPARVLPRLPPFSFLRWTKLSQFQAAVYRVDDNRATWNTLTVALWQRGLKPNVRCLQVTDKPVTSLKEAIDRARRHEATGLDGGHVSALPSPSPIPVLRQYPADVRLVINMYLALP